MDIIDSHKLMGYKTLQSQYDNIYSYFRTTCVPFDLLEWDGKVLNVWNNEKIIEVYKHNDLKALDIFEFTDPKDYNSIKLVKSGKYQINQ